MIPPTPPHDVSLPKHGWRLFAFLAWIAATMVPMNQAQGYPLDAGEEVGIGRLEGFRPENPARGAVKRQPPGALLGMQEIQLHLVETDPGWDLDEGHRDPQLQKALEGVFLRRDPSYGVVVVDFTDPTAMVWAGVRENRSQMPGSVGKVLTLLGLFHGLAQAFPDPIVRRRILGERVVTAGEWVKWDQHKVPRYDPKTHVVHKSIIQPGERFTLAEWIDHMIASSANAAGATVWKEALLLRYFKERYPPSAQEEETFFQTTPKKVLWQLAWESVVEPMVAAGLDPEQFRVGSFWTRTAKYLVPGAGNSHASPREMARFLLRLEQGRLVDLWSSLEMKRFLYTTSRRYRYVYPSELAKAAVYFKSGSFYRCQPEPGFRCGKYRGNRDNLMNSLAIIESPAMKEETQKRYLVALMSNVRRKNSAWDHARLSAAIEGLIRTRGVVQVEERGTETQKRLSTGEE